MPRFQPKIGEIAQLVEQRTENSRVVGSTPTLATIFYAPIVYRLGHGLFMPVRGVRLSLGVPSFKELANASSFFAYRSPIRHRSMGDANNQHPLSALLA